LSFIYERVFGYTPNTLLEIGAFDGISYSNSSGLIEAGWNAILVEPVPEYATLCKSRYRGNPRVEVCEIAVGDFNGHEDITICGPLSSIDMQLIEEYRNLSWAQGSVTSQVIQVPTITLRDFLRGFSNTRISLFIIDVEGSESKVLFEFETLTFRPDMLIVELSDFHPTLRTNSIQHLELSRRIQRCGYSIIYKDAINTIFLLEGRIEHLLVNQKVE
jgi:FkbM family methyltransferase